MDTDVAIVGAGPYGLALAAHLRVAEVDHRIFGRPMDMWRNHMPKGMLLKSDGFASSLFDPGNDFPLSRFCIEQSIDYSDERTPVRLQTFVDYALAFKERFVPNLEETIINSVRQDGGKFVLNLSDGTCIQARRVVVAIGVERFRYIPAPLDILRAEFVSHSYDHHDLNPFAGRRVAVIGAGASAIDLAGLLNELGCEVQLICRSDKLKFANPPAAGERTLWQRMKHPRSGLGPGWRSRLCTDAPLIFHFMPEAFRLEVVRRHLGPAAGWPMRDKVIGRVPVLSGHQLISAAVADGLPALALRRHGDDDVVIQVDHIIAATGYRVDIRRLDFLEEPLLQRLEHVNQTPILSTHFESSIEGLFFVGPIAANSFGPLMRFAFGAGFASRRLMLALGRSSRTPSPIPRRRKKPQPSRSGGTKAMTPRVLLAQSTLSPNIGRLAIAFRRAGFAVDAVAPAGHPIHRMRSPDRTFIYRPTSAYISFQEAIDASRPELLVPCDDRIVGHLHRLHKEASAQSEGVDSLTLAALIESSLGPPASYDVVAHRRFLASLARLPDVHIPQTDPVETIQQLKNWARQHGLPAVLKLDGSSGGRDVILITEASQIAPRFLRMRIQKSALQRVKAALFNGDVEPFFSPQRFSAARVSVQSYVAGRVANCAIACWRGEVLASIAVEVTRSRSAFGLATAVRQVGGDAMVAAARSIARHLQLSGLCGFDFVLDDEAKQAKLIEINPRATQISHFPACEGPDLPTALFDSLSGETVGNSAKRPPHGEVALFPHWQRDPNSELLSTAFHDLPYEEPELLRFFGYKYEMTIKPGLSQG